MEAKYKSEMAEPGPQPQNVPVTNPSTPAGLEALQAPQQPAVLQAPQQPAQPMAHLNWSHFKPEFSGKTDKDAEAHLLCTNDWIDVHHFVQGVKVQRFCLTLLGEARLWCHSLKHINVDWQGLHNLFRH